MRLRRRLLPGAFYANVGTSTLGETSNAMSHTDCGRDCCLRCSCGGRKSRTNAADTACGTRPAGLRDDQGRGHRQRLHLSLSEPPVDVRRHQGRRDRHRSDRAQAAAGRDHVHRGDQEGHQAADQVRDLQPQPLGPRCRRQAVQGPGRDIRRPQERQGAAAEISLPRRRDARRGGGQQAHHHSRRHHARASLRGAQSLRQQSGDAAAEGKADLHRRLRSRSRRCCSATCPTRCRPRSGRSRSSGFSRSIGIA